MKSFKITSLLLAALFLISCSNDDDIIIDPAENCKIITMTSGSGNSSTVYNISYNNDGKISQLSHPDGKLTWLYNSQGMIHSRFDSNNHLYYKADIELNANGHPISIAAENYDNNGDVTSTTVHSFEYNNQGELIKWIQKTGNNPETTQILSWSGGNLTQVSSETHTSEYEYYTDQVVQQGDFYQLYFTAVFGTSMINNKNLVKSTESSNGDTQNVNYEYDQEGRITKLTISYSSGDELELSYQYQCN
ncbi:hypothetical protein OOZ15_19270 [Galbibacter sp. EGI 63066]|uniref:hypothetical protein n=1 Tax=Galbibacter sp. EGI 63066 TaxID=2993559 RepID=UPI0022490BB9|nr:hypothetical protein [Galbibacter sp. EGI 63066]MCX2682099.1 hypothetical protein [Galbibacter sp. EGI 63066]